MIYYLKFSEVPSFLLRCRLYLKQKDHGQEGRTPAHTRGGRCVQQGPEAGQWHTGGPFFCADESASGRRKNEEAAHELQSRIHRPRFHGDFRDRGRGMGARSGFCGYHQRGPAPFEDKK